jgi:hypothetical protein
MCYLFSPFSCVSCFRSYNNSCGKIRHDIEVGDRRMGLFSMCPGRHNLRKREGVLVKTCN